MLQLGLLDQARPIFKQLINLADVDDPIRLMALRCLITLETQSRQWRASRDFIRQALRLAPNAAELYEQFALNIDADESAPLEAGYKAIRQAVRLDPNHPRRLALCGRLALAVGKRAFAQKVFDRICRMKPTDLTILKTTMIGLFQLEQHQQAYRLMMQVRAESDDQRAIDSMWQQWRNEWTAIEQQTTSVEPVILPFVANPHAVQDRSVELKPLAIYRVDRSSAMPKPHIIRRMNAKN